ncbi:DUF1501 domain-containing protein [Sandarakinorhabdus limnophila]|uniref:DUF1501 domain-containing protein n=1 Tax=Sandarakinorhabdus limnophila TaxID=210512 RepID=UPI0023549BF6|nr:DUF1501 domain-containing protein [Sandarakinorhabdus limnophila]
MLPNMPSRRTFLKDSAALGIAASAAPFIGTLGDIGAAAAATATDYKALVCVFLFGGNDYANTLVPYDTASYATYSALRSTIAIPRADLAATALTPATPLAGDIQYALAPALAPLLPVFNAGKMAAVLNVGTLIQPTTKAQYLARNVPLPPKLFSHNDQQSFWQSSTVEGAKSGWGGRMADLFLAQNSTPLVTAINAAGNAVFLTGRTASQYAVSSAGPIALNGNARTLFGSTAGATALQSIIGATQGNLFGNELARISSRALTAYTQFTTALTGGPTIATPFPTGNTLADQLKVVARLISASQELGAKRQVFFVSLGGFDLHSGLLATHPVLLGRVADAMRAFYDATVELGVASRVTAFTASDFGRTLLSNSSGSDHGWGSMHFVVGGAVNGRNFYGKPPVLAHNGPDDVGQGRLLPAISVDQYAATMASWFGVSAADMESVLPFIGNYPVASRNLGFI